jgi:hypothetical protein
METQEIIKRIVEGSKFKEIPPGWERLPRKVTMRLPLPEWLIREMEAKIAKRNPKINLDDLIVLSVIVGIDEIESAEQIMETLGDFAIPPIKSYPDPRETPYPWCATPNCEVRDGGRVVMYSKSFDPSKEIPMPYWKEQQKKK